jgi:rsbT co-antagonist protein RsbR
MSIDQLGLWVTEIFLKAREEVIERQQQEMLELSTPVVKLWQGILALPTIGTLDSARTQLDLYSIAEIRGHKSSDAPRGSPMDLPSSKLV